VVDRLLAQDILELYMRFDSSSTDGLGLSMETVLVGALVADLVGLGRVVVQPDFELVDHTISIIDRAPTGDGLLDEVLHVLATGGDVTDRGTALSRPGALGWLARRRLMKHGTVSGRDLPTWFRCYWSCREFTHLAPTLLRQILTLQEQLSPLHERVRCEVETAEYRRIREIYRTAVLDDSAILDARTEFVVALCGRFHPHWLRESLCDNIAERRTASNRGKKQYVPLARTVAMVVKQWDCQFD
jgi:hypothetical protein